MGNKISRIYSDIFRRCTTPPEYYKIKGLYPSSADTNDKIYRMGLEKTYTNFILHRNASLQVALRYLSGAYYVEVFCDAGLAEYNEAQGIYQQALMRQWTLTGAGKENIGAGLHSRFKGRDGLIVAMIACQGSFYGSRGWTFLTRTLIQGGWPWLGNYAKDYAKVIYLAMICLFCIVRHAPGTRRPDIGQLILALAAKLVDPNCFGVGMVKVRVNDELAGKKVTYEPVPKDKVSFKTGLYLGSLTRATRRKPTLSLQLRSTRVLSYRAGRLPPNPFHNPRLQYNNQPANTSSSAPHAITARPSSSLVVSS
jgi:hypothetical protein